MSDILAGARLIVPKLPMMLRTAVSHSLSLNPEASKWDLKSALIINTIRSIMEKSHSSVTRQQNFTLKDPGRNGPMWIVDTTFPAQEDDVRQLLFKSIDELKDTGDETYDRCDLLPVEAEWTGYRADVSKDTPQPQGLSQEERYTAMMKEVKNPATILYFHGGALYLMDPATHRVTVSQLCKLAGGCRALSVRYRLAPQHPFPSAILDCLVAYLNLLYPAPGSIHTPVKPEHIVFAGDSAGGNLSLALLQLLLHIQRQADKDGKSTLRFNGQDIPLPLPLPGAVATNAAWSDTTRSMPSITANAHYDYLPRPSTTMTVTPAASAPTSSHTIKHDPNPNPRGHYPGETLNPFPCPLWPSLPPRADVYCNGTALIHPLVSPLICPSSSWANAPPLFFECGEEMLADEVRAVARRAAAAGVPVRWIGFEAMPHCFAMMLQGTPVSKRGLAVWGEWIGRAGEGRADTGATWVRAPSLETVDLPVEDIGQGLSDEECWARMRAERKRRIDAYEELRRLHGDANGAQHGDAKL